LVEGIIAAMPGSTDNSKADKSLARSGNQTSLPFWFLVWGGTTAAGGVFGFLVGCSTAHPAACILGLGFGVVFASMYGAFTIANVAIVTWCFWLSRYRVLMGCLAGGLTGVIATLFTIGAGPWLSTWGSLALAGLLGTLGGGLAGRSHHSRAKAQGLYQPPQQHRWRFTLRDLFLRVTVISALLAAYVFVVNLILAAGRR